MKLKKTYCPFDGQEIRLKDTTMDKTLITRFYRGKCKKCKREYSVNTSIEGYLPNGCSVDFWWKDKE